MVLHLGPARDRFTNAELYQFCQSNRDWRIERNPDGDLAIMPPAGGESGQSNSDLNLQLGLWNRREKRGVVFDSSTGFFLPNSAMRSPDAAWMDRERWNSLTRGQKKAFPPLAPDFVVELRSETDSMPALRAKMREYIECGVRLGWLIDPIGRRVEINRPGKKSRTIRNSVTLSGAPELPGFTLEIGPIRSS
jgi:Uma2 family endonuclease